MTQIAGSVRVERRRSGVVMYAQVIAAEPVPTTHPRQARQTEGGEGRTGFDVGRAATAACHRLPCRLSSSRAEVCASPEADGDCG